MKKEGQRKSSTQKEKRVVRHRSAKSLDTDYLLKLPKNYLRTT